MPDDDHPVTDENGPPIATWRTDREQIHKHDMLAIFRQQLVEPFDVSDPANPLGAFEDATRVETSLELAREPAVNDRFGPGNIQISVGRIVHQINNASARWPSPNLAKYRFAVGLAVPLHVGEPGLEAQCGDHRGSHLAASLQVGDGEVTQRDRCRTDPFVHLHLQRTGSIPHDVFEED